jgi:hypothetical protein
MKTPAFFFTFPVCPGAAGQIHPGKTGICGTGFFDFPPPPVGRFLPDLMNEIRGIRDPETMMNRQLFTGYVSQQGGPFPAPHTLFPQKILHDTGLST